MHEVKCAGDGLDPCSKKPSWHVSFTYKGHINETNACDEHLGDHCCLYGPSTVTPLEEGE